MHKWHPDERTDDATETPARDRGRVYRCFGFGWLDVGRRTAARIAARMSDCPYRCLAPDGARCEHPVDHQGPHRNGLLIWHDPPVLFVGGKPYVLPIDPAVSETSH